MQASLEPGKRIVGLKQSRKAIADGTAALAYIAEDAEERIIAPLLDICRERGVPVRPVATMAELGRLCGIAVGAAVVVLLKDTNGPQGL